MIWIRHSGPGEALQGFRDGTFDVIIATDVAARGIDVSGVTHVINYTFPKMPKLLHRIGRTDGHSRKGTRSRFSRRTNFLRGVDRAADQPENRAAEIGGISEYVTERVDEQSRLEEEDWKLVENCFSDNQYATEVNRQKQK